MTPVVVLVGPPGAGKSTVGAALAELLDTSLRDTDADIAATTGLSIQDLFVQRGEPTFRELEEAAVADALASHDGVLALGGGAVLSAATRSRLADHPVAFLEVDLATAATRAGLQGGRPLLLGNVRATLKRLLDERRALYLEVADLTVNAAEGTPTEIAAAIRDQLQEAP